MSLCIAHGRHVRTARAMTFVVCRTSHNSIESKASNSSFLHAPAEVNLLKRRASPENRNE
jgi:hypothetical protein